MPAGLKRFCGKGELHFVTFSCYQRLPLLNTVLARDLFVKELGSVRDEMHFRLIGYVVMPNHIHLLISEPPQSTPSLMLHKLKLSFSRKFRKGERSLLAGQPPFAEQGVPPRAFWQPRFYDFNVYSNGKKTEKLTYMHANPVVRGLVEHPKDWPWSSWSFYGENEPGLIRIDTE
ncbi:MAG: transposase [Acidobacteriota bacterium]|nr:transposase [Acidobacteriota bacterium]